MPGRTKSTFNIEPPQVELAMATKTGSGQYSGCPESSAVPFPSPNRTAVITAMHGLNQFLRTDLSLGYRRYDPVRQVRGFEGRESGLGRGPRCPFSQLILLLVGSHHSLY